MNSFHRLTCIIVIVGQIPRIIFFLASLNRIHVFVIFFLIQNKNQSLQDLEIPMSFYLNEWILCTYSICAKPLPRQTFKLVNVHMKMMWGLRGWVMSPHGPTIVSMSNTLKIIYLVCAYFMWVLFSFYYYYFILHYAGTLFINSALAAECVCSIKVLFKVLFC